MSVFERVLGNLVHTGTTEEDRFIGVEFAGGIQSLFLSTSFGGIEIDHVQYASIIPLPAPLALGLAGLAGVVVVRRKRLLATA